MAKNFSQQQVWGVTAHEFSYSSSSLLWTIILSVLFSFSGVHVIVPFLFNIVISVGIIAVCYFFLKKIIEQKIYLFVALLAVIFVAPLPALTFSGMEHLLHIFLTVVFLFLFSDSISRKEPTLGLTIWIVCCSTLLAMTRFEGLVLCGK